MEVVPVKCNIENPNGNLFAFDRLYELCYTMREKFASCSNTDENQRVEIPISFD